MAFEQPIVTIQLKRSWYWAAIITTFIITVSAVFIVTNSVVNSGDLSLIFFISAFWLVALPTMFRSLATGEFRFFNDRLEISTFLFSRLRTFYYQDITVNQHGAYRVTIHQRNLPGWANPLLQIKALYICGTTFSLLPHGYKDPTKLHAVLQLLKNSTVFNEKALS